MKILIIINDPPYGTERSFNGLRIAKALGAVTDEIIIFLMADGVICASKGQKVPSGYYNIELMLKSVLRTGRVLMCGTCMDARGLKDKNVIEGVTRSTMAELAAETVTANQVIVF